MSASASSSKQMKLSEQRDLDDPSLLLLQQYPLLACSGLNPRLANLFKKQIAPALAEPGGPAEKALSLFRSAPPFLPALLLEQNADIFCHMVSFLRSNVALNVLGCINHAFHAAVDGSLTSVQLTVRPYELNGAQAPALAKRFPLLTELSLKCYCFFAFDSPSSEEELATRVAMLEWQRRLLLHDGLPLRLTTLMLGYDYNLHLSDVLYSQQWPRLERLSLGSVTDLAKLLPQDITDDDHESHTGPPALLFPRLQVLKFSWEPESGMHLLAQAIRRGLLPRLCSIETGERFESKAKHLRVFLESDKDVANAITVLQQVRDTSSIDMSIKISLPMETLTPFYHSLIDDDLFARLRCLVLGHRGSCWTPSSKFQSYQQTVSFLNALCVRGVAPCLEYLSVQAPLKLTTNGNNLEEGSLPQLTRLSIGVESDGSKRPAADGPALVALAGQLLKACGDRLEKLRFYEDESMIEASSFKGLIGMLAEVASSAPWRGMLQKVELPTEVGRKTGTTIALLGQDKELMTSTCVFLSQLSSLQTLQLGPPCMSTILGLLQAKETGSLPALSVLELCSLDTPVSMDE